MILHITYLFKIKQDPSAFSELSITEESYFSKELCRAEFYIITQILEELAL